MLLKMENLLRGTSLAILYNFSEEATVTEHGRNYTSGYEMLPEQLVSAVPGKTHEGGKGNPFLYKQTLFFSAIAFQTDYEIINAHKHH